MNYFLASLRKDLKRYAADPAAVFLWLGIPVVIGGLMHVAMGGSSGPRPVATLLLVDEDDSWLGDLAAGGMGGGDSPVRIEAVSREEGEARMAGGEASALLVLPAGFTAAFFAGTPTVLEMLTNPAQRILPGILEEGLEMFVELAFYVQRILGEPLGEIASGPAAGGSFFAEADTARIAIDFQRRFSAIGEHLFPPAIDLEMELGDDGHGEDAGPEVTFSAVYFPGLVYMGLLFTCLGLSIDLWRERDMGTLVRAMTTPHGASQLLLGKLAAGAVIVAGICVGGIAIGIWAYGYPWSSYPAAVLWSSYTGVGFLVLFMSLQGHSNSERGGNVLASLLIFPLIMLGGSFFPFEAMPDWMAALGRWTPNGMAVVELKQILFDEASTGRRSVAIAVLGVTAIVAYVLLERRLRTRAGAGS